MTTNTETVHQGKMDLLEAITFSLEAANVKNANTWNKRFPFELYRASDSIKQRIILNEEWRRILTWVDDNTEFNSFDARFCLLPESDVETWYRNFVQFVVPFVRRHDILSQDW